MRSLRNVALSRALGILAIAFLPAFIWFGWWLLAISAILAAAAALLAPRPAHRPAESRVHSRIRALRQRAHPHSWRPGRR